MCCHDPKDPYFWRIIHKSTRWFTASLAEKNQIRLILKANVKLLFCITIRHGHNFCQYLFFSIVLFSVSVARYRILRFCP